MKYVAGVFTDGFKQLMNGKLKPSTFVEAIQHDKPDVFHALREVPSSAEEYIESDPETKQRWAWLIEYIKLKSGDDPDASINVIFGHPYYKIDYSSFPPFHILCNFYRNYIYCESRMLLLQAEYWFNELEISLLKYELYHLKYNLTGLLKSAHQNLTALNPNSDDTPEKLDYFLNRLLFDNLFILLLEINLRYEHLLDAPLTAEILYPELFEEPVPEQFNWYWTAAGIRAHLEKVMLKTSYLEATEELLLHLHKDLAEKSREAVKDLQEALQLVENTWLCAYLMVKSRWMNHSELSDADENTEKLNALNKALEEPDKLNDVNKAFINRLVRQMDKIKTKLTAAEESKQEKTSAAWNLILPVETTFLEDNGTTSGKMLAIKEHKLSKDYVLHKKIAEDFETTVRTVNDKVDDHGLPYIQLGNHRWLHNSNYQRLLKLQTIKNKAR